MAVRLNRISAFVLLCLLYPVVLVLRLVRYLTGRRKPTYVGTIPGDPLTYDGDRPLLIAVWDESSSIWSAATADIVAQLKDEFTGRCEVAYVEASCRDIIQAFQASIVPVLILRHRGQEVDRFVNTMEIDEVRPAIIRLVEPPH